MILDLVAGFAQRDTLPYNRKQEIIYDNKRYRKWNNYLTIGAGKLSSNVQNTDQAVVDVDYNFHLQKQYFQIGVLMSGPRILTNNNISGHVGYGFRYEKPKYNLAAYAGPCYAYFITTAVVDSQVVGIVNSRIGGYACLQGIYKIKYDVGIGLELFADITSLQQLYGARIVLFFSGAYRGERRGIRRK